jgi:predicted O-methyltransferase YrrM
MNLIESIRDGLTTVPLLRRLGQLGDSPTPETLVDVAMSYKVIRPLQVRTEILDLARIVADARPHAVLEIGTFRGGTLFVFSRLAAPDAVIVSLDLPVSLRGKLVRVAQGPLFHRFIRGQQSLHLLREDSHQSESVAHVAAIRKDRPLDFLFIDGDHAYEGVKADFELHSRTVRPGGIVAFHDIAMKPPSGVPQLWEELKSRYRHQEIVHDRGPKSMGIGVLWI